MRPPVRGSRPQQPRGAADPSATRPAFMNNSGSEPNSPGGRSGQRLSCAQPDRGPPGFRDRTEPHHRARMPRDKKDPSPYERAGSEAINATVARVTPAVLELLGDGVPRSKAA